MAKITLEKLAFQLAVDVNRTEWKSKNPLYGSSYADNLAAVLMTITLCAKVAKKNTPDSNEAAWEIAQLICLFLRDPEDIRDHFTRCLKTGYPMYSDVKPDDQADDQTTFNAFVLRALELHGLLDVLRQKICQFQEDKLMRCYSPIAWKRRWPWTSQNIFGVVAA